jgi:hypothetical protein
MFIHLDQVHWERLQNYWLATSNGPVAEAMHNCFPELNPDNLAGLCAIVKLQDRNRSKNAASWRRLVVALLMQDMVIPLDIDSPQRKTMAETIGKSAGDVEKIHETGTFPLCIPTVDVAHFRFPFHSCIIRAGGGSFCEQAWIFAA